MAVADDDGVEGRLRRFLYGRIGRHLRRREQRESFALYAQGIIGEGERKSVEPIAARATADAVECERMQAKLLHFLRDSPWDDRSVRRECAYHVVEALQAQEPVTTWIIDDTGFPKQGRNSVGVQRQYSGTLGKVGNTTARDRADRTSSAKTNRQGAKSANGIEGDDDPRNR